MKEPDPEITEKTHDLVNHVDKLMSKLQRSMDHVATGQLTASKAQAFNTIMARLNEVSSAIMKDTSFTTDISCPDISDDLSASVQQDISPKA